MKMGTTVSPWRYDSIAGDALRVASLGCSAIQHYASWISILLDGQAAPPESALRNGKETTTNGLGFSYQQIINKIEPSLRLNFSGFSAKGTRTEDRSLGTPMSNSLSSEATIASFPGPVVLFSSRPKLWFLAFFEIVTILTSSFAIVIGLSHPEARFALCIGLLGLLYSVGLGIKLAVLSSPDAISLRLTTSGFEVVAGLQKRTFLWTQVSDFDAFAGRSGSSNPK